MKPPLDCPCGGGRYAACCERWHAGEAAPDAEALMRSRYSAFALGLTDYLLATWHPDTRPATLDLDESPAPKWIGLQVLAHQAEGDSAQVEFIARYKIGGRAHRLHENSRFLRRDGRWYYVDGIIDEQ
ncbi:YchJ family protein [Niveibacterium sp.]|uniref:YchJ family protein n=1 Tax=Niveibacterium sp. TaxID=2017444 RepID=UPI0035AE64BD